MFAGNYSFPAEVPGGIYTDLEKIGYLPRNLVGFNDVKNRWIANESIAYTTNIEGNEKWTKFLKNINK